MSTRYYLIEGINPEPWTASESALGRRNGKVFVQTHKSAGLTSYQASIKEYLEANCILNPLTKELNPEVELMFYFWRQLPANEVGRKSRKHRADATNMQKALEDALQGVLFNNDSQVVAVHSWIMEQGWEVEPRILIGCTIGPGRPYVDRIIAWQKAGLRRLVPVSKPRPDFKVEDVF